MLGGGTTPPTISTPVTLYKGAPTHPTQDDARLDLAEVGVSVRVGVGFGAGARVGAKSRVGCGRVTIYVIGLHPKDLLWETAHGPQGWYLMLHFWMNYGCGR